MLLGYIAGCNKSVAAAHMLLRSFVGIIVLVFLSNDVKKIEEN